MIKVIEMINGTRIIPLEETKSVIAHNNRTDEEYELKFTKMNGSSYKVSLNKDEETIKETTILTSGKMVIIMYKSILTFFFREDELYIILPEEIELSYEYEEKEEEKKDDNPGFIPIIDIEDVSGSEEEPSEEKEEASEEPVEENSIAEYASEKEPEKEIVEQEEDSNNVVNEEEEVIEDSEETIEEESDEEIVEEEQEEE